MTMKKRQFGIFLSYVNTILNMVVGLFLSSFLLRTIGKTEYGIYQTVSAFASYLVLLQFGTGTVMTRNISICRGKGADRAEIERNVSTIWTITKILSICLIILSGIFYVFFGDIYGNSMTTEQIDYSKKILIFVSGYLIFSYYQQTLSGVILAFENYIFSAVRSIARILIRLLLLVVLLTCYRHAIVIAVVDMAIEGCILVYMYWFCKRKCDLSFSSRYFDWNILKNVFPLCAAILIQTFVNQANSNVDKTIIGIFKSPEDVTLYSISLYIYGLFSTLTTIPISMYAPQIAKDMTNGIEKEALVDRLIQPCRFIVLIGGTILFGFIAVGRQFVEIVYGKEYTFAWIIAIIIMCPMLFNMANGILVNALDVLNKRWGRSIILFFTTILNIICSVLWVTEYGMLGLAVATALATIIGQVILANVYYSYVLKINSFLMYKRIFSKILVTQLLSGVLAFGVGNCFQNTIVGFFVGGITFVIVFAASFLLWGANKQEKQVIGRIVAKCKGRR